MYTIGQIAKMFHLPISTLRYYDKEGLFPGMEIKDIKQFMEWCSAGSCTYPQRKELFLNQKKAVENEICRLEKVLDMLRFKCWYYEQAIKDGSEDRLNEMLPNNLPVEIQAMYDHAHEK